MTPYQKGKTSKNEKIQPFASYFEKKKFEKWLLTWNIVEKGEYFYFKFI